MLAPFWPIMVYLRPSLSATASCVSSSSRRVDSIFCRSAAFLCSRLVASSFSLFIVSCILFTLLMVADALCIKTSWVGQTISRDSGKSSTLYIYWSSAKVHPCCTVLGWPETRMRKEDSTRYKVGIIFNVIIFPLVKSVSPQDWWVIMDELSCTLKQGDCHDELLIASSSLKMKQNAGFLVSYGMRPKTWALSFTCGNVEC